MAMERLNCQEGRAGFCGERCSSFKHGSNLSIGIERAISKQIARFYRIARLFGLDKIQILIMCFRNSIDAIKTDRETNDTNYCSSMEFKNKWL
ncbi:hypothetical protein IQ31_03927 [Sphingobacterium siyangense]|uniref:Uncharacterized protein n=1 Tax=Sphingobacterium siyangense TaxID=459529 RepID=A0A562MCB2_9SPHI|nr:hypothetical protein IQ31_03927 [Sphingobacterium siyangense]